jgi:hypothetical protein
MALKIADRVKETTTTVGSGSITLAGAVTGYRTFASVLSTADTTYYCIADQGGSNWEVGLGTFTSPTTLARTTILSSSNSGSVVTFGAGTKDVFITEPSSQVLLASGATMTGPLLINSGGGGNIARFAGATTGNAVVIGIDSSSVDPSPNVVVGNVRGSGAFMLQPPDSAYIFFSAVITAGGTGYTLNDIITLSGGTTGGYYPATATVKVTAVSAGVITAVAMQTQGSYTAVPANPVAVTGGTGSGATLTATWYNNGGARGLYSIDLQTQKTIPSTIASGTGSVILGGYNNTNSGNNSVIVCGNANTITSNTSVICGGQSNSATGLQSVVSGGFGNSADSTFCWIPGGAQASTHGLYGAGAGSSGQIATAGDAQWGKYILRGRSVIGSAVRLTASGAAAGSANVINIPLNTAWMGTLGVVAREVNTGNCCYWHIRFGLGVQGSAGSTTYAEGTVEFQNIIGSTPVVTNLTRAADTSNRGLNLTFSPPVSSAIAVSGSSSTITGTAMVLNSVVSGTVAIGQSVSGTGVTAGTYITAGSGLNWTVSPSQTVTATTFSMYSTWDLAATIRTTEVQ